MWLWQGLKLELDGRVPVHEILIGTRIDESRWSQFSWETRSQDASRYW